MLTRFEGRLSTDPGTPGLPEPRSLEVLDGVCSLDREVTGTDRSRLVRRLAEEHGGSLRVVENECRVQGYLLARPGSRARQVGPCIASERAGPLLLADAARRYAGAPVFLDVATGNAAATAWAESSGLTPGRLLTRMGRGRAVAEDLTRLWCSAGPEKG
jgi:hypothetical protein